MYKCIRRVILFSAQQLLDVLEKMEKVDTLPDDTRHIDEDSMAYAQVGRLRYQRYGIRGVPAKQVDVLMPMEGAPSAPIWLEIGEKQGRYDGAWRDRLTLRPVPHSELLKPVTLGQVDVQNGHIVVKQGKEVIWSKQYRLLDHRFDPTNSGKIIMYHYQHYYGHLRHTCDHEVQALAASWSPPAGADKNAANRAAGRALYELSRQCGWRKLTINEKERYGLPKDHPQWVRDEELVRLITQVKKGPDYYASLTPVAMDDGWQSR